MKLYLKSSIFYLLLCFHLIFYSHLNADFFAKVPEFNPGDGHGGYDLFKPPWYPVNPEESEKYSVNEKGELIEASEAEQSLLDYGKKTKTKAEEIRYQSKKISDKLIFEKVVGSPKTIVWDFYGHAPFLVFDMSLQTGFTPGMMRPSFDEYTGCYPPIPWVNRTVYDAWVYGAMCGWNYNRATMGGGAGLLGTVFTSFAGNEWKGLLVPNLREFAVFLTAEGVATAKHSALMVERDLDKKFFNPGLAALRAYSGHDYGFNAGKWQTEFINPFWTSQEKVSPENYSDWDSCVRSIVLRDITSKRVPERNAFYRVRDVPELSEPVFLDLIETDKATLVAKRNLASLLENFTTPQAARALHKLARDEDTVTAIRAVNSLSRHPHGRVRQILIDWLTPETDDIRRTKSILMMGRTNNNKLADRLLAYWPQATDDMERELILRSLMRLRSAKAEELFQKNLKNKFETLAYTSQLGLLVLDKLSESQAMKIIDEAFRREDAIPSSGKVVSFAPKFRSDLIKWMAHTQMKKPRRRLWKYIREFKSLGDGSEVGGVAHILSYGLYELELGDEIITAKEAIKTLNIMASRQETNVQLRIPALARLYELDKDKCLKVCQKMIEKFLKGKKVHEEFGNRHRITEVDFLTAAINLSMINNPEQQSLIQRIMKNRDFDGHKKSLLLENLYNLKKKLANKIVKDGLKHYLARTELNPSDKSYLIRLLRFAGTLKEPKILKDVTKILEKNNDPWLRFVSMYSLRLALNTSDYTDVMNSKISERSNLAKIFREKIKKIKK